MHLSMNLLYLHNGHEWIMHDVEVEENVLLYFNLNI